MNPALSTAKSLVGMWMLRLKIQWLRKYFFKFNMVITCSLPPGGGGGYSNSFIRGGSAPRSNPLPFYIPYLSEKVTILTNGTHFTYLTTVNALSLTL